MLTALKQWVPFSFKRMLKHAFSLLTRRLAYLELHLTDHCNLNCRGCLHYSSIASVRYAGLRQFDKDMRRLAMLFSSIKMIRLMGGEPLLHPEVDKFICVARSAFPRTDLRVVTNGILLPKAAVAFWSACRSTAAKIDWTSYPPLHDRLEEYRSLCKREGVSLLVKHTETFCARGNLKGDSPMRSTFRRCQIGAVCSYLQDGRLYACAMPSQVHYFNDRFGYRVTADPGIDIHADSISGRQVLRMLNRPVETCRWCSNREARFAWSGGGRAAPEDWDAEAWRSGVERPIDMGGVW